MMRTDRIVEKYRGHDIVARKQAGACVGVVWNGKSRVHSASAGNLEVLVRQLKEFVDGRLNEVMESRAEPPGGDEYVDAFRTILSNLAESYLAMLKAHYHAPQRTMTATELAAAAGYDDYGAVNLHYGKVGRLLNEVLPTKLPVRADGTIIYTFALAEEGERPSDEAHWAWKLRPQVAYALETLGLTL